MQDQHSLYLKFEELNAAVSVYRDRLLFELRGNRLHINYAKDRGMRLVSEGKLQVVPNSMLDDEHEAFDQRKKRGVYFKHNTGVNILYFIFYILYFIFYILYIIFHISYFIFHISYFIFYIFWLCVLLF